MSGYAKGTRKPKRGFRVKDIGVGGLRVKPAVAIASLLAALYAVFLVGTGLESGLDALLLAALSLVMFVALAYLVRSGGLSGLKPFTLLIDALLALSALSLAQALAGFLGIFGPAAGLAAPRLAFLMAVNAGLAAAVVAAVLYFEKGGREGIYLKASPLRSALAGFAVMAACALVAAGLACLLLGGMAPGVAALNVLAFGLFGGVYEEALFRGLLLSRLRQVVDAGHALAIQAIVFAVFEALAVYVLFPNLLLLPVVLVAGAAAGYYFGVITLKNESILVPQLIHAGLYMLLAVLLLALAAPLTLI